MPDHFDVSNLKPCMLDLEKLTEQEESHLLHCKECMASMAEATLKHLEAEEKPAERKGPN